MEDFSSKVTPKILGIAGSPRKNGNSDVLLKHLVKGAEKGGIPTQTVHLRNYYFQPCIGCEGCRKTGECVTLHDGMQLLYPEIMEAKGLILVCPTHNYNVTAWMKAFLDRLYCFYIFTNDRPRGWSSRLADQKRKAVISAVCEQPDQKSMGFTLEAMRLPIEALGYEVVDELPVFGVFDRGKVAEMPDILAQAEALGEKLASEL